MEPVKQQDGYLLHFLKELPGWVVVSAALVFFTGIYMTTRDDFIPRILDALIGAFLGLVVSQRPKATPATGDTNITTATVETPLVTTQKIDNSVINTDSINPASEQPVEQISPEGEKP
jgi:hypothetical protein